MVGPSLRAATASSSRSSRNSAWRALASGPWHWKQLSDRIGRMSLLNSISRGDWANVDDAAESTATKAAIGQCFRLPPIVVLQPLTIPATEPNFEQQTGPP